MNECTKIIYKSYITPNEYKGGLKGSKIVSWSLSIVDLSSATNFESFDCQRLHFFEDVDMNIMIDLLSNDFESIMLDVTQKGQAP